ncbi:MULTISPECIES: hypothetical protein [Rhizobium/Agrobacterium group]|jgi:hypothetical protein|uniref:Uncharacterized protein n=1 Tax=Rhizobium soli TaxID=424798 RepID=A0A7X0JIZ6_9HYPH|nr:MULTISPECIES: hypothetical protein [Rhizobium/Agrobacterium group]KQQ34461.1 hypothetical protein ASG19_19200 [Rhizobium sp. Leaf306]MBB6508418.1 hypothetical protein [Rhizobium soli]NSY17047.1 hypothetical protein [Neorhizobium sp. AL 9.2.2]
MPTVEKQTTHGSPSSTVISPEIREQLLELKSPEAQARLAAVIASLGPEEEREILEWMERVADWNEDEPGGTRQE